MVRANGSRGAVAPRRIVIVDDHPIVRHGFRKIVEGEPDLLVCGEAESPREARAVIGETHPDMVIADITLKGGDGLELVRDIRSRDKTLPILVLSMHDERIYAERVLLAGAHGYVMKQVPAELFLKALRQVLEGGIYVSEAIGHNMVQRFAKGGTQVSANPIDALSNREVQILHMIGKGSTTKESAKALNLSVKTIESHRQRIKRKLHLSNGAQLVQYAINWFSRHSAEDAQNLSDAA